MSEEKDDIDNTFDKLEKGATRLIKLITLIVTGIAGVVLAAYLVYDQIIDKHNDIKDKKEYYNDAIEQSVDSIPLYE